MEREPAPGVKRGRFAPYGLLAPGVLWLALFFLVPLATLLRMSLSSKANRFDFEPDFTWEWSNYSDAITEFGEQFRRSFAYAGIATVLCILIGYPLAYVIAFRGGRYRNLLLGLVVVPFFTSYLIRTFAWRTLLADEGPVVSLLQDVGVLADGGRLLATSWAVIGGLTYNFLPFMVLPIYVALEKIDVRLVDAARDLYSNGWRAFRKVVLPLSLPGVFAGSLLTFIPASGDFVNAQFLGGPNHTMIGNVVQNQFLVQLDYPTAAALGFILMTIITVAVLVYARILGTEELV
ncbi:MAG: ABC transporter permease [Acidimicrobiia bacterium]|nr:MAG: ABC transporter permease [Acidimicrobiia bacterium]